MGGANENHSHKTELLHSRILVSIGGNITDSYLYKAFGEELLVSGTTARPTRCGSADRWGTGGTSRAGFT